jgi:protease-4
LKTPLNFIKSLFSKQAHNLTDSVPDMESLKDPAVQQAFSNLVVHDLLKDRQAERRWKVVKRTLIATLGLLGISYYVFFYAYASGVRLSTNSAPTIGVVRVNGNIMQTSLASSEKIVPALQAAFSDPNVKAVVLAIDSPGGAPLEAERINFMIEALKKKHNKPVYAAIQNVGASAAYMIAMNTDRIYAGRYSLVGSIGAVMSSWDVHKALNKLDIHQDVYASGQLKSMLNPFTAPTDAAKQKAQELVNKAGSMFVEEVKVKRGSKLLKNVEYGTGEIWDGDQALKLGLIDELGTIEKIAEKNNAQVQEFGPGARTLTPFAFSLSEALTESIAKAITQVMAVNAPHSLR